MPLNDAVSGVEGSSAVLSVGVESIEQPKAKDGASEIIDESTEASLSPLPLSPIASATEDIFAVSAAREQLESSRADTATTLPSPAEPIKEEEEEEAEDVGREEEEEEAEEVQGEEAEEVDVAVEQADEQDVGFSLPNNSEVSSLPILRAKTPSDS